MERDVLILKTLQSVDSSISKIEALKACEEFYSKEQRHDLYNRFKRLIDADNAAYERLSQKHGQEPMTREQLIDKFGDDVANERLASMRNASEEKMKASQAISNFKDEHPLIEQLYRNFPDMRNVNNSSIKTETPNLEIELYLAIEDVLRNHLPNAGKHWVSRTARYWLQPGDFSGKEKDSCKAMLLEAEKNIQEQNEPA